MTNSINWVKNMVARKKRAIRDLERKKTGCIKVVIPDDLHPETAELVEKFAAAMAEKLHNAEKKYGYKLGWQQVGWMDVCREELRKHLEKGDPRDVANYCAFLWYHGERC